MKCFFAALVAISSMIFCQKVYSHNARDSAIQLLSDMSIAYDKGKLSEEAYLDTVHVTIRSFLSKDIHFTNKELLDLLAPYRKVIWANKSYEDRKRQYYGILSNQAQMAGREGEMLYYAKKINDLEQKNKNQPSLTAISIITDYYNTKHSYEYTKNIYEKDKHFILNVPVRAHSEQMEVGQLVQATIALNYIGEALYQLNDTTGGAEIEATIEKVAKIVKEKYESDDEAIAHILYAQIRTLYQRGRAKKSNLVTQDAFRKLEVLSIAETTPDYLRPYIEFQLSDWKVAYFLKEKNIDSTAYYLDIFNNAYKKESVSYNAYVIHRYQAQALYNKGLYKESADVLQSAIKILDSSRSIVAKDIDDMMYARAEAEEQELLLAEAGAKRKKMEGQLLITIAIIAILFIIGLFIIQFVRRRQRYKFLEFKLNMARNIHDETSPALLYAKVLAKASRTEESKSELEQHIGHTMEMIRGLSHDLKSDKQHATNDLFKYTEETLKKLNAGNTFHYEVEKNMDGKRFISHYQFSQLKAVLNECITNTIKHAKFNMINISFQMTGNKLIITYSDDGQGWDMNKENSGIGIRNMEDRCRSLNGEWTIDNNYPNGYEIKISVLLR